MGDLGIYRDTSQLDHDVEDLLWENVAHELTNRGVDHDTAIEVIRRVAATDDWH
ncbi:hypothetical protein F7P69_01430 [Cellulosimicrobium funkei]|nr:hypothetical protein [Cellulosimicrobium funkei]